MTQEFVAKKLKTVREHDDELMEVYFLDPPIVLNRHMSHMIPSMSFLIGFHFSPSEGGQVVQMWELDSQLRMIKLVSFEPIIEKLQELGYDPEGNDVTPILKAFGYERIS